MLKNMFLFVLILLALGIIVVVRPISNQVDAGTLVTMNRVERLRGEPIIQEMLTELFEFQIEVKRQF